MSIFISHASEDGVYATRVAKVLRKAGHSVWTAQEILPGDNWASAVGDALAKADALVALISPNAMASEWVKREWQFALGQERFKDRLIPVLIKNLKRLPWILAELHMLHPESPEAAGRQIVERLSHGRTGERRSGERRSQNPVRIKSTRAHSPRRARAAS